MNKKYRIFYFLIFTFCFASCLPSPHYQKVETVPQNAWSYNFKPKFTFEITDTTAGYETYFIIRHTQAYPFSNLWLWLYIKTPGDSTVRRERVNVPLAQSNGKWLGNGMGELFQQQLRLNLDSVSFKKPGTYQITVEQNMRVNPLPEVLNVGMMVKKRG